MAQGQLIAAVVVLGVGAELLGGTLPRGLAAGDLATGAITGAGGAWLLQRRRAADGPRQRDAVAAALALAAALLWFAGTLDGSATPALDALGGVCALAYRGPLLHLLLRALSGRVAPGLAVAAWLGAFLTSAATIAVAVLVLVIALAQAWRAGVDRRRALLATAAVAGALAAVWAAALAFGGSTALTLANDVLVAVAVVVALATASGVWARAAASRLVVALGRERHAGRPVTAQLARALADPDLELSYAVPGFGWVDERGRAVPAPVEVARADDRARLATPDDFDSPVGDGRMVTRAAAPGGAEVALTHAPAADPRLAAAATAAAALALDSARLEAELRATAAGLRASRRRLLTTAEDERRALGEQLDTRVLARLRRLERLLADEPARAELAAVRQELAALGNGLHPPVPPDIAHALHELAARTLVPTGVSVDGTADLPPGHRAALWFICAEALANVDKHAAATTATLTVRITPQEVTVELIDNGRGGAVPQRGLRGIGDRVAALGGRLEISSPPGGPTRLTAAIGL